MRMRRGIDAGEMRGGNTADLHVGLGAVMGRRVEGFGQREDLTRLGVTGARALDHQRADAAEFQFVQHVVRGHAGIVARDGDAGALGAEALAGAVAHGDRFLDQRHLHFLEVRTHFQQILRGITLVAVNGDLVVVADQPAQRAQQRDVALPVDAAFDLPGLETVLPDHAFGLSQHVLVRAQHQPAVDRQRLGRAAEQLGAADAEMFGLGVEQGHVERRLRRWVAGVLVQHRPQAGNVEGAEIFQLGREMVLDDGGDRLLRFAVDRRPRRRIGNTLGAVAQGDDDNDVVDVPDFTPRPFDRMQQGHNDGDGFDGTDAEGAVSVFHGGSFSAGRYYSLKMPLRHSGRAEFDPESGKLRHKHWIPACAGTTARLRSWSARSASDADRRRWSCACAAPRACGSASCGCRAGR